MGDEPVLGDGLGVKSVLMGTSVTIRTGSKAKSDMWFSIWLWSKHIFLSVTDPWDHRKVKRASHALTPITSILQIKKLRHKSIYESCLRSHSWNWGARLPTGDLGHPPHCIMSSPSILGNKEGRVRGWASDTPGDLQATDKAWMNVCGLVSTKLYVQNGEVAWTETMSKQNSRMSRSVGQSLSF
jgi:hypothetical protein